jgi:hypothetical protein
MTLHASTYMIIIMCVKLLLDGNYCASVLVAALFQHVVPSIRQ